MKKSTIVLASTTALAAFGLFAVTPAAHATTAASATSTGVVGFTAASSPGSVDPSHPTVPIIPTIPGVTDPTITNPIPTDPNYGLTLDTVPSLNFGIHTVSQANEYYNAYAETTPDDNTVPIVNYAQVSDLRGLDVTGNWTLSVSQTGQFGTGGANTGTLLKGATISFSGANVVNPNAANDANVVTPTFTLDPGTATAPGAESIVYGTNNVATNTTVYGVGTNLDVFGPADATALVTSNGSTNGAVDDALNTANATGKYNPDVRLNVLANTATAANYSTTLSWTLSDQPDLNS